MARSSWRRSMPAMALALLALLLLACKIEEELVINADGSGTHRLKVSIPFSLGKAEVEEALAKFEKESQERGYRLVGRETTAEAGSATVERDFLSIGEINTDDTKYRLETSREGLIRGSARLTVSIPVELMSSVERTVRVRMPMRIASASAGTVTGRTVAWSPRNGGELTVEASGYYLPLNQQQTRLAAATLVGGALALFLMRRARRRREAFCASCKTPLPPGARFCGACGAAVVKPRGLALKPKWVAVALLTIAVAALGVLGWKQWQLRRTAQPPAAGAVQPAALPEQTVQAFLAAAGSGDFASAHGYFAEPLKQVQPLDQFRSAAAANHAFFQVQQTALDNRVDAAGATLDGTVTLTGGTQVPASFKLVRENDQWRLVSYLIGSNGPTDGPRPAEAMPTSDPEMAAIRLMVTMNPSLELVSSDDTQRTLTVRSRATNETVTLAAADVLAGRVQLPAAPAPSTAAANEAGSSPRLPKSPPVPRAPAMLELTTTLPGVTLEVDGKPTTLVSGAPLELPAGSHQLLVGCPVCAPLSQNVTLPAGQVTRLTPALTVDAQAIEQATERAGEASRRGDYDEAIEGATTVVAFQPQNRNALRILAESYFLGDHADEFVDAATSAVRAGETLRFPVRHRDTKIAPQLGDSTLVVDATTVEVLSGHQPCAWGTRSFSLTSIQNAVLLRNSDSVWLELEVAGSRRPETLRLADRESYLEPGRKSRSLGGVIDLQYSGHIMRSRRAAPAMLDAIRQLLQELNER